MRELTEEERLIRRYLLRQLDDEGRRRFEERVFTDRAYLEQVSRTEDELIEDFVFGELPAPDRERFLTYVLPNPQQARKVEVTSALKEYAARAAAEPERPAAGVLAFIHRHKRLVKLTLAAALLVAALGGAWLLMPDPLTRELARLNSLQAGSSLRSDLNDYPVTLTPMRVRGADGPAGDASVSIPPGAQVVQLRLALMTDAYDSYRVVLGGGAVAAPLVLDKLKAERGADGKVIPVRIPARLLTPGYYQLMLSGHSDGKWDDNIDSYTFRVVAHR